jgi:ankyrin repeat protein
MTRLTRLGRRVFAAATLIFIAATAPDAPIADAAMRGDVAAVRTLIAQGADVNAPQGDGMTALHWAAELGSAELAQVLIRAGAKLEATTRLGAFTPLHIAGEMESVEVIRVLLAAGASPNAVSNLGGETPLHFAAQTGSVEALSAMLDRGADVNVRSASGQTPLMFAAQANRPEAVKALIERGGDPSITTVVIDMTEQEKHARAAERARDEIWKKYRDASPDPVNWVPTSDQVQEAMQAARKLEAMGPEVNRIEWDQFQIETKKGLSSGQSAGYKGGMTALLFAVRDGRADAARALLDGGADINQRSAGDFTSPLLIAMINGWFDLGLELLARGADPKLASDAGTTPLFAVVNTQWGARPRHPQRMNHLIQKATYLETMKALMDAGADPNARLTKHIWYMAYTSGGGGYLGIDLWGATPFLRAAHGLDVDAMKLLVSYGADWNIPTKAPPAGGEEDDSPAGEAAEIGGPGVYPIHAVAGFGSYTASNYQRYVIDGWMPAVKYMVEELGVDPNIRDYKGFNTSHYAAMRGNNELLVYLVEHGADPTVVGRGGQTASDLANGPGQGGVRFDDTIALLRAMGVEPTKPCPSCADLIIR